MEEGKKIKYPGGPLRWERPATRRAGGGEAQIVAEAEGGNVVVGGTEQIDVGSTPPLHAFFLPKVS